MPHTARPWTRPPRGRHMRPAARGRGGGAASGGAPQPVYSPSFLARWYALTATSAARPGTHANSALCAAVLARVESEGADPSPGPRPPCIARARPRAALQAPWTICARCCHPSRQRACWTAAIRASYTGLCSAVLGTACTRATDSTSAKTHSPRRTRSTYRTGRTSRIPACGTCWSSRCRKSGRAARRCAQGRSCRCCRARRGRTAVSSCHAG